MAIVHLICGPVGAGKTTCSNKFCEDYGCMHFAIDEWMTGLFMPDVVEADMDIRWQRVQKRNAEKGETYSTDVNRDMFDFCEGLYEKPDQEEETYLTIKC